MKMLAENLRWVFGLMVLWGSLCGCKGSDGANTGSGNLQGGACLLNVSSNKSLCFKYNDSLEYTVTNQNCVDLYNSYRVTHSVSSYSYESGTSTACTADSVIGVCTVENGAMYYYSDSWTAANSLSDCSSSLLGQWTTL